MVDELLQIRCIGSCVKQGWLTSCNYDVTASLYLKKHFQRVVILLIMFGTSMVSELLPLRHSIKASVGVEQAWLMTCNMTNNITASLCSEQAWLAGCHNYVAASFYIEQAWLESFYYYVKPSLWLMYGTSTKQLLQLSYTSFGVEQAWLASGYN